MPAGQGFQTSLEQQQLLSGSPAGLPLRNQVVAHLPEGTSTGSLEAALATLVGRYEILRTTFSRPPGLIHPVQVLHDDLLVPVDVVPGSPDGRPLPALAAEDAWQAPLDLVSGPVMRAVMVASPAPTLVLTAAAAVADATSLQLLVDLLRAELADGPSARRNRSSTQTMQPGSTNSWAPSGWHGAFGRRTSRPAWKGGGGRGRSPGRRTVTASSNRGGRSTRELA